MTQKSEDLRVRRTRKLLQKALIELTVEKGAPALCAQSFRRFIEQEFRHKLPRQEAQADPRRPPIDLSVSYILHAGIGAILWWLENDQPATPEQVAVWLNQFSRADISVSLP